MNLDISAQDIMRGFLMLIMVVAVGNAVAPTLVNLFVVGGVFGGLGYVLWKSDFFKKLEEGEENYRSARR